MKLLTTEYKTAKILSLMIAIILALLPFHAFLAVWLSSMVGHYTLLRLWKEFLLMVVLAGATFLVLRDKNLVRLLASSWLIRLMAIYCLLILACGLTAYLSGSVSAKAMWYGLLVDVRYLIFFIAVLVVASKADWLADNWQALLFWPAAIVALFAILQFLVLPYDFLRHFGYGPNTISPYETINHNLQHIRVASTLRGANPLGAYLILPICALAALIAKNKRLSGSNAVLGAGLFLSLVFSFSRSAWIGSVLGLLTIIWLSIKSDQAKKILLISISAVAVIAIVAAVGLHNNLTFENTFLHTDRQSKISSTSNENHVAAFKGAANDVLHNPLGSGVGSAGPQSVYNNQPARIAENYYLQIGQEAGVLGMALFISINLVVAVSLYRSKEDTLALAMLASLVGLSFVNMLSHAWEDDTLAYLWWGLAGIALAPAILARRRKRNGQASKTAK